MWWAIPLATSLMGARRAEKQADAQKRQNLAQSEQTRYSFASGGPQGQINTNYVPSAMEGAIGGGIQGLGIAQGLGLGGMGGAAETATPAASGHEYANVLGGNDYANKLGQMSPSWLSMPTSLEQPNFLARR